MISALHVCVAFLVVVRLPAVRLGTPTACLAALPALAIGGWALTSAAGSWNVTAQTVFVCGASLTLASFLYLGRRFAILPAARGTVSHGPYRLVRHPAYLGELIMILGCWLATLDMHRLGPLITALPAVAIRIIAEERLLAASSAYRRYARRTRWRLVPGLW
jgi:protein-S-isoprenylcysteine O-methyltransferase Ste14